MTMNKDEIFNIWAPEASLWWTWTKPVLFSHLDRGVVDGDAFEMPSNIDWCPPKATKVVVVVNLPGVDSVRMGVALAARGYRPVPLYNAIPLPNGGALLDPISRRRVAAVDVLPVIKELCRGAEWLGKLNIPDDAPLAFLLDANRLGGGYDPLPEEFDNRSVCYATDFPSANFLLAHGFQQVLLIQKTSSLPQSDLAHVLRRWQEAGIGLNVLRIDFPMTPEPLVVGRPSWYGAMFQRALTAMGLRRARSGGFGAWVPESGAGG